MYTVHRHLSIWINLAKAKGGSSASRRYKFWSTCTMCCRQIKISTLMEKVLTLKSCGGCRGKLLPPTIHYEYVAQSYSEKLKRLEPSAYGPFKSDPGGQTS